MAHLLDRLEHIPVGRPHRRLQFQGGLGYVFDSMDSGVVAFLLPVVAALWSLGAGDHRRADCDHPAVAALNPGVAALSDRDGSARCGGRGCRPARVRIGRDVGPSPGTRDSWFRGRLLVDRRLSITASLAELFRQRQSRRTVVARIVWLTQTFAYYGFITWIPSQLVDRGLNISKSFTFTLVIYIMMAPGYFTAAYLNDIVDRKWVIAGYSIGGGLPALGMAPAHNNTEVLIAGIAPSLFLNGVYAGLYSYTPEISPTRIWATGVVTASAIAPLGGDRRTDRDRFGLRRPRFRRRLCPHGDRPRHRRRCNPDLQDLDRRTVAGGHQPTAGRRPNHRRHEGKLMLINITNATVLDLRADQAELLPDQQIVIDNGRIRTVGDPEPLHDQSPITIDAGGRVVMPGLIDGHVHVTAYEVNLGLLEDQPASYKAFRAAELMRGMLDRGFTTVRDVGGADFGLARAVAERRIIGPRLIFGGQALSQSGGHGDGRPAGRDHLHDCCESLSAVADGVDEVLRKARNEIRRGAHHIKIMLGGGVASPTDKISDVQYSPEEIRAAVLAATNAGKYVAGHAYTTAAVRQGLENGVRSIEHGNLMDESVFGLFVDRKAYYVPTLVAYDAMARAGTSVGLTPDNVVKNAEVVERGVATLEAAARAGVKIVFGTDLLGELQTQQSREFLIRKEVQSAEAIIRSATTVAAELIGRTGELGVIAPGAVADLLIIETNPLDDVGVLADPARNLRAVIANGTVHRCDL